MRRNHAIWSLALGHTCVDLYQGCVVALVPLFIAERGYTYAAASGVVLAASLFSSLAQPLFGALTDKWAMPWLVPASTMVGGVGVAACGLADSYALTLALVAISGIGVAAYHPESARLARITSAGSHQAMAVFSTGGNVGFVLAPLAVAAVVAAGGLSWTPLLVLPAFVGIAITLPTLKMLAGRPRAAGIVGQRPGGRDDVAAFIRLSFAVVFRSVTFVGMATFIALYVPERIGGGPTTGTVALILLYGGGIVGSLLGGMLAGRWSRIAVSQWAYATAALAVAGVVWAPGPSMYLFIVLTSVALYVPFSLQVTLAQDYLRSRVGTASGVTLGLTVSIGGLASPIIGAIADATSLQTALVPLVVMPILSWACYRTLRAPAVTCETRPRLADTGR